MSKLKCLMIALPALFLMVQSAAANCRSCGAKHATHDHYRSSTPVPDDAVLIPGSAVDLPTGAKPGECFARVASAAQFETTTEQVVIREASDRLEVIPAEYETISEQVLVKPASFHVVDVPGKFERVSEQVLVTPSRTEWQYIDCEVKTVKAKTACNSCNRTGGCSHRSSARNDRYRNDRYRTSARATTYRTTTSTSNDKRLCLVEIPAKYETISRLEMVEPPSQRTVEHAAEYKTVTRQVVKTAARTERIEVPAQYGTINKQVMLADAQSIWQQIDCRSGASLQNAVLVSDTPTSRVSSIRR